MGCCGITRYEHEMQRADRNHSAESQRITPRSHMCNHSSSIHHSPRSGQPQAEAEPPIPTEPAKKKISLEEAARLWRSGANSNRKLMKAMGLTYHQTEKTRETLINGRLIDA